jgi:hypothetical protein
MYLYFCPKFWIWRKSHFILQLKGTPGEYQRRGIAELPDELGMVDKGWEIWTVIII